MKKKEEKVLVLVTAQKSSLRLIEHGFAAAEECGGELHILHVQKGESIFEGEDALRLLQDLMEHGGRRGGVIHIACENDIAGCIGRFVREEGITQVVMGSGRGGGGGRKKSRPDEYGKILEALPAKTAVTVVPAEARKEKAAVWRKLSLCAADAWKMERSGT